MRSGVIQFWFVTLKLREPETLTPSWSSVLYKQTKAPHITTKKSKTSDHCNFPNTSMEPTNRSLTRLDTMPNGMLRLIVSKVGAASSTDYCNTVLTCKSLNFSLDDPLIAKTLNIAPLVERPHLVNRYEKTMESLLAANNLDAHYVKGMREYFYFDNHFLGLHHLRLASKSQKGPQRS